MTDKQIYNTIYAIIESYKDYIYYDEKMIKDLKIQNSKLIFRRESPVYNKLQKDINDNIETYSIRIKQHKQSIQRLNKTLEKIRKKFNEVKTILAINNISY